MARPAANSITDVEKIAKRLISRNFQVTPYRVQKELGGGSYAWIKGTLDQLGYGDTAGLPDGIDLDSDTAELFRLIQPLVDHLNIRARAEMDRMITETQALKEGLESTISDLQSKLKATKEFVEAEQIAHLESKRELADTQQRLSTRNEELHLLKERIASLEEQHKANSSTLAQKDELLDTLKANHETSRLAAADHLRDIKQDLTQKLVLAEKELSESRRDTKSLRGELVVLNRQNAQLIAESKTNNIALSKLESKMADKVREYREVKKESADLQALVALLEPSLDHAKNQVEEAQRTLDKERQGYYSANLHRLNSFRQLLEALPKPVRQRNSELVDALLKSFTAGHLDALRQEHP